MYEELLVIDLIKAMEEAIDLSGHRVETDAGILPRVDLRRTNCCEIGILPACCIQLFLLNSDWKKNLRRTKVYPSRVDRAGLGVSSNST